MFLSILCNLGSRYLTMKLYIAILFFLETQAAEIVKRPNGDYFITGRGCGISNPIRYLKNFPPKEKLEEYKCSFVQLERGTRPLDCKIMILYLYFLNFWYIVFYMGCQLIVYIFCLQY